MHGQMIIAVKPRLTLKLTRETIIVKILDCLAKIIQLAGEFVPVTPRDAVNSFVGVGDIS